VNPATQYVQKRAGTATVASSLPSTTATSSPSTFREFPWKPNPRRSARCVNPDWQLTRMLLQMLHDQLPQELRPRPARLCVQSGTAFVGARARTHTGALGRERAREREIERAPWERLTPCHTGQQGNVRQVFSQRKRILLLVLRFRRPCPTHHEFLVLFFSSLFLSLRPSSLSLLLSSSRPFSPWPCYCCKWALSSRNQSNTVGVPGQASIWTHHGYARAAKARKPRHPTSDSAPSRFWRRLRSTRRPVQGKTVFCLRG